MFGFDSFFDFKFMTAPMWAQAVKSSVIEPIEDPDIPSGYSLHGAIVFQATRHDGIYNEPF